MPCSSTNRQGKKGTAQFAVVSPFLVAIAVAAVQSWLSRLCCCCNNTGKNWWCWYYHDFSNVVAASAFLYTGSVQRRNSNTRNSKESSSLGIGTSSCSAPPSFVLSSLSAPPSYFNNYGPVVTTSTSRHHRQGVKIFCSSCLGATATRTKKHYNENKPSFSLRPFLSFSAYSSSSSSGLFLAYKNAGDTGHHDISNSSSTPEDDNDNDTTNTRTNMMNSMYHTLPRLYVGRESLVITTSTTVDSSPLDEPKYGNEDDIGDSGTVTAPCIVDHDDDFWLQRHLEECQLASPQMSSILTENAIVSLSAKQSHYLSKVMRLLSKPSKSNGNVLLRVFDGANCEWLCRVVMQELPEMKEIHDKNKTKRLYNRQSRRGELLRVQCIQQLRPQIEHNDKTLEAPWLFFAPIKSKRMRLIIEKCTELGVGMFCPIVTEFTDSTAVAAYSSMIGRVEHGEEQDQVSNDSILYHGVSTKRKKSNDGGESAERLFLIASEAAEQCERLNVPRFVNLLEGQTATSTTTATTAQGTMITFKIFLEMWNQQRPDASEMTNSNPRVLLVCRERTKERHNDVYSLLEAMDRVSSWNKKVAFLIGPEGGWSPEEESMLDQYCKKYPHSIMGVTLGSNVLRTETASILAIGSFSLWCDVE